MVDLVQGIDPNQGKQVSLSAELLLDGGNTAGFHGGNLPLGDGGDRGAN